MFEFQTRYSQNENNSYSTYIYTYGLNSCVACLYSIDGEKQWRYLTYDGYLIKPSPYYKSFEAALDALTLEIQR